MKGEERIGMIDRLAILAEIIQDRFTALRDSITQALCRHDSIPEYREIQNDYNGEHHYTAFWECSKCGDILKVEASTFHRDPEEI